MGPKKNEFVPARPASEKYIGRDIVKPDRLLSHLKNANAGTVVAGKGLALVQSIALEFTDRKPGQVPFVPRHPMELNSGTGWTKMIFLRCF